MLLRGADVIKRHTKFAKDTMCYSCNYTNCKRANDAKFKGVEICHSYRDHVVKNKLIDDVIYQFEQGRGKKRA